MIRIIGNLDLNFYFKILILIDKISLKFFKYTPCPIKLSLSFTTPHGAIPISITLWRDFGWLSLRISPICFTTPLIHFF